SSRDLKDIYVTDAINLGHGLGEAGHEIIYGGGNQGLMAVCAGAAGAAGSKIIGIIPDVFNKASPEVPHPSVTTELVENLFARKEKMLFEADLVVVLAGGIGTLDEMWEAAAANDIESYINESGFVKPVIILNTNDFFEGSRIQMERCVDEGCVSEEKLSMFHFADDARAALGIIADYTEHGMPNLSVLMKKKEMEVA
ncbi:MAG: hypothetical protein DI586_07330, partial [Micavibrio aeruginosavorus]